MGTLIGGGNLLEISPFDSAFDIAAAWPGTLSALDNPMTFVNIKQSALTGHPNTKNLMVDLTQYKFDAEFDQIMGQYVINYTAPGEEKYEDGTPVVESDALSYDECLLVKSYGKLTTAGARVVCFVAFLSGGDVTYVDGAYNAPKTTLTAIAAPSEITIDAADIESTKVNTAAEVTIASGSYGTITWM